MSGSLSISKKWKISILILYIVVECILLFYLNLWSDALKALAAILLSSAMLYLFIIKSSKIEGTLTTLLFLATALSSPKSGMLTYTHILAIYSILMAIEFVRGNLFIIMLMTGFISYFYPPFIIFVPIILAYTYTNREDWNRVTITSIAGVLIPIAICIGTVCIKDGADPLEELQQIADALCTISTPFSRMHPVSYLMLILAVVIMVKFASFENSLYKTKAHLLKVAIKGMFMSCLMIFIFFNSEEQTKELLSIYIAAPISIALCSMFTNRRGKDVEWIFILLLLLLFLNTLTAVANN